MIFFLKKIFQLSLLLMVNLYFLTKHQIVVAYDNYTVYNNNFKTFLLGDSHSNALGDRLEKFGIHNFSRGSDSLLDILIKIKHKNDNVHLDKIILSISEHQLSNYRKELNNSDMSIFLKSSDGVYENFKLIKLKFIDSILMNDALKTTYRKYLRSIFLGIKKGSKDDEPWAELSVEEKEKKSQKRMMKQYPDLNKNDEAIMNLIDIINFSKKNNVELIVIKMPITKEYHDLISNIDLGLDSLLQLYNIKYYDFRDLYLQENTYFRDQDHLNGEGADSLALIFDKIINNNESYK
jgi:hypothetical protein